jgi:hypothetical protein
LDGIPKRCVSASAELFVFWNKRRNCGGNNRTSHPLPSGRGGPGQGCKLLDHGQSFPDLPSLQDTARADQALNFNVTEPVGRSGATATPW